MTASPSAACSAFGTSIGRNARTLLQNAWNVSAREWDCIINALLNARKSRCFGNTMSYLSITLMTSARAILTSKLSLDNASLLSEIGVGF